MLVFPLVTSQKCNSEAFCYPIETYNDSLRSLKCFLGQWHVVIILVLFSFFYNLGQVSKKNCVVFFSFVVCFRLIILF